MYLTSPASAEKMPAEWIPFVWEDFISSDHVFHKATINLPAKLDNINCYVQLDTGANYTFGLSSEFRTGDKVTTATLQIGSNSKIVMIQVDALNKIKELNSCGRIGLVGNAFFEMGTISLDLQQSKFKFEQAPLLENDNLSQRFVYANKPAWEGGHIAVKIKLPERTEENAILDTGAAMFTFAPFDRSIWDDIKNRNKKKPKLELSLLLPALSKTISCEIKMMEVELIVGKYQPNEGLFGFCDIQSPRFSISSVGVVGMHGFLDGTLVVDYVSRKWKFSQNAHQPQDHSAKQLHDPQH